MGPVNHMKESGFLRKMKGASEVLSMVSHIIRSVVLKDQSERRKAQSDQCYKQVASNLQPREI